MSANPIANIIADTINIPLPEVIYSAMPAPPNNVKITPTPYLLLILILPPFLVIVECFLLYEAYHSHQDDTGDDGTYHGHNRADTVVKLVEGCGICKL